MLKHATFYWLLLGILWLPACARWSETCHVDSDCQECERCFNGQCDLDPGALNPCGDCAPTPEEICYDHKDNDCDNLTDEGCDPCGNGYADPGETCDGDCPTECGDADSCTSDLMIGSPETCDVECEYTLISECLNDDGCCPDDCDRHSDQDCNLCGNGQFDPGETCDSDCPTECDDGIACTRDSMSGRPEDCDVVCSQDAILECANSDGCCLPECTSQNDDDCIRDTWLKTYGGSANDEFATVLEDSEGGYLVAGQSESYGQEQLLDVWLLRLDQSGYLVHQSSYYGQGRGYTRAVLETADGILLIGHARTHTTNWNDWRLIKTDLAGQYLWQRTCGSEDEEFAYTAVQTNDLGFTIAGYTSSNWGNSKGLVMHLDQNGDLDWKKTLGESGEIYVRFAALQKTSDGGYIVAGSHYQEGWDALAVKLDSRGDLEWKQAYGGDSDESADAILVLPDGYLLAGHTESFGAGDFDAWVVKLNPSGAVVWQKAYGTEGKDLAAAVQVDPGGGFILAGETTRVHGFTERQHIWLLRLDPDGSLSWQKAYGGPGDSHSKAVLPVADGYLVAGNTKAFGAGGTDGLLMKTDQDGNISGSCPEDFISATSATAVTTTAIARNPTMIPLVTDVTMDSDPLVTAQSNAFPEDLCLD